MNSKETRGQTFNSLPNNKILDLSKLKTDDKIKMAQKLKIFYGGGEHTVGKGENAGYQHFLLFLPCFQKVLFAGSLKVGIVW